MFFSVPFSSTDAVQLFLFETKPVTCKNANWFDIKRLFKKVSFPLPGDKPSNRMFENLSTSG